MFDSHIGVADAPDHRRGRPVPPAHPRVPVSQSVRDDHRPAAPGPTALAAGEPFRRLTIPPVIPRRTSSTPATSRVSRNYSAPCTATPATAKTVGQARPLVRRGRRMARPAADQRPGPAAGACYRSTRRSPDFRWTSAQIHGGGELAVRRRRPAETGGCVLRMVELVTAGRRNTAVTYRGRWLDGRRLVPGAWLRSPLRSPDDPFFGPGKSLPGGAADAGIKFELKVPVATA